MKKITLKIDAPCQEQWESMAQVNKGRFCSSCQHEVVDFVSMTDRQLADYLAKAKGRTCGRFMKDQLDREIIVPRKPLPWIKYLFTIAIPAFIFSLKASANTRLQLKPAAIENRKMDSLPLKSQPLHDTAISGRVVNENGEPLAGATVVIKGTKIGVAADSKGKFMIHVPNAGQILQISYVGYESKEVTAGTSEIVIRMNPYLTGEVVVVVGMIRPPRKKEIPLMKKIFQPSFTGFSVYPNPATSQGMIHLELKKKASGNYRVNIVSASGTIMQSEPVFSNNGQFDLRLHSLSAGMYSVTLINTTTGKELTEKIVVE